MLPCFLAIFRVRRSGNSRQPHALTRRQFCFGIDDVTRRTPIGFTPEMEGHQLYLLGETEEELSGSEWAHVIHGHLGGRPPAVDLEAVGSALRHRSMRS